MQTMGRAVVGRRCSLCGDVVWAATAESGNGKAEGGKPTVERDDGTSHDEPHDETLSHNANGVRVTGAEDDQKENDLKRLAIVYAMDDQSAAEFAESMRTIAGDEEFAIGV